MTNFPEIVILSMCSLGIEGSVQLFNRKKMFPVNNGKLFKDNKKYL